MGGGAPPAKAARIKPEGECSAISGEQQQPTPSGLIVTPPRILMLPLTRFVTVRFASQEPLLERGAGWAGGMSDAEYEAELAALMERHRLEFEQLQAHHRRDTKTSRPDPTVVKKAEPTVPSVRLHEKLDALVQVQGQVRASESALRMTRP